MTTYTLVDSLIWGFIASIPLLIGTTIALFINLPKNVIGTIMAFGSGVLIAALSFSLIEEAFRLSQSLISVITGFLLGGLAYTIVNYILHKKSKGQLTKRKRSHGKMAGGGREASGLSLLAGSVMDNIPENMALGISMVTGGAINIVLVVAIFISNLPEGLASASGMKSNGKSKKRIISIWFIAVIVGTISPAIGFEVLSKASSHIIAIAISFAAGAIIVMLAESMIPEAFEEGGMKIGIATMLGFGIAFILGKLNGG